MRSSLVTGLNSLAMAACCSLIAIAAPGGTGEQVAAMPRPAEAGAPAVSSTNGSRAVSPVAPATGTAARPKATVAKVARPANDDPGLVLLLMLHQLGPLPYLER
jgi:hypothetical protein